MGTKLYILNETVEIRNLEKNKNKKGLAVELVD
jgi:hypothetical protein